MGSLEHSIGIRHLYAQYFQCCCVDKDLLAYQTPQICLRNREKNISLLLYEIAVSTLNLIRAHLAAQHLRQSINIVIKFIGVCFIEALYPVSPLLAPL